MIIHTIIIGLLILQTFHKGWDTDAASHNPILKKSKSASVRSTKCAYTIVVNEVDASQCPVMTQPVQSDHTANGKTQKKSTVSSSEVQGLTSKIHNVETTLLGEIVKNRELNTTLTQHSIMLEKAEDRFLKYQNNFTSLFRAIMFMEQKIRKQKEISRNLDNKLSNIMLDVVEVNNVLSRKTPGPGTSLKDKQIKVESAAHVRQCGITDDTDIFQGKLCFFARCNNALACGRDDKYMYIFGANTAYKHTITCNRDD